MYTQNPMLLHEVAMTHAADMHRATEGDRMLRLAGMGPEVASKAGDSINVVKSLIGSLVTALTSLEGLKDSLRYMP
ncbi:MAG: hypothetical protein ACK2T6_05090 [Anaerolineae bacterium]|jgi:hypothetical protein